MKLPRDIDGRSLALKLAKLGFEQVRQSGSHSGLKHMDTGESVSVPAHRPLKIGTMRAVLRDVQELTGLSLDEILRQVT